MDLSDPTRSVTSTLDGPVLAVMAAVGKPLTVGQVAELAVRGSEIGVRRSLDRLVSQGIIRAQIIGRTQVYELNREHLAASVAVILAGLRNELWRRLREELQTWTVRPLVATAFGSVVRADGDEASDIDLLVVHPPFLGETPARKLPQSTMQQITDLVAQLAYRPSEPDAAGTWQTQLDRLRDRVEAWTGNQVQIVDLDVWSWQRPDPTLEPLLANIRADGIDLVSPTTPSLTGAGRGR
ncbi:MAG: hypothetical protein GC157_04605 [Frankiales bacterium]|nr:hypothetical protein [Frankiales bacterium]